MSIEIKMPKLGLTMTTGTVVKWLKKEGDAVKKGEEIVDITTEKITNTIEAPGDGVLLKIIAPEGAELPIGGLLGIIGEAGEKIDVAPPSVGAAGETGKARARDAELAGMEAVKGAVAEQNAGTAGTGERIKITPAAAKLAREMGVDYTGIIGTGPGGRITREDVETAAARVTVAQAANPVCEETPEQTMAVPCDLVPYSGMRKVIGDNMSRSWAIAPKVTHHVAADVSKLLELRKMINEDMDKENRVSITDLLVKIVAKALEMKPEINVQLDGNSIKLMKDINIGVAVALEKGLVVPVIKNANKKTLFQVNAEVKELAQKARENRLGLDEMSQGTFTVTNLGAYGSVDFFTPIINQPESAILGIGRTVETPVVVDGQVVARPVAGLSLAFDHRIIDGVPAAEFLAVLLKLLAKPVKAVL